MAFGHPMFGIGEVYLPLVDAEIHAFLPSLAQSFKMSSPLHEVGTLVQDRQSCIIGDLDARTTMMPVDVRVTGPGADARLFHAEVARNRRLTPMLASLVVGNAIADAEPDVTDMVVTVTSKVNVKGHAPLELRDQLFSSEGVSGRALASSRGLRAVGELLFNPFEPVVLDRMDVDVRVEFRRDIAEIVGVSLPGDVVHAGDTVPLRVTLRPYAGPEYVETVPVVIPRSVGGDMVKIEVATGAQVKPDTPQAESLRGYIDNLRKFYTASSIVVSVQTPDDGASLRGRLLSGLPAVGARHPAPRQPDPARRRLPRRRSHGVSLEAPGQRQAGADGLRARRHPGPQHPLTRQANPPETIPSARDDPIRWMRHAMPSALALARSRRSAAAPARANATKTFRQTTAKDFEEGEATGSMILPTGEVVAGMKTSHVAADAAFVWCAAPSRDGAGRVLRHRRRGQDLRRRHQGRRQDGRTARARVADLDAAWVTALAVRPDGVLLAGTTPGGRVYTVDPKNGAAHELATLAADHVWSLVYDAKSGTTYAGTGSPGKIFAIDGSGKTRALWDSGDKHVVSLAGGRRRARLLAGTSEEAILYRVALDGRGRGAAGLRGRGGARHRARRRRHHDRGQRLREDDGAPELRPAGRQGHEGRHLGGRPAGVGGLAAAAGQRKSKAALYRLERDGRIEQIFAIADGYFTSLAVDDATGDVYAATGTQGRVYRVRPDRTAALAIDLPERQALTLVRAAGSFLIGTGDVGGVYRAQPAGGDSATYLSKVLDGEFPARWGMLRWHGTQGAHDRDAQRATRPSRTRRGRRGASWIGKRPPATAEPVTSPAPARGMRSTGSRWAARPGGCATSASTTCRRTSARASPS